MYHTGDGLYRLDSSVQWGWKSLTFSHLFLQDNINIDEATRFLVEHILTNLKTFPSEENDVGKIKLDPDPLKAESKSQCC